MGTSRGYSAPTGGAWPPLKRLVTDFGRTADDVDADSEPNDDANSAKPDSSKAPSPEVILARYIQAHAGPTTGLTGSAASGHGGTSGRSGGGGSGRQGGAGLGRSVTRVGRNLGRFAARVNQVGLADALRDFALGHLVGRPAEEVASGIVERLSGPGTTMDAVIAQIALNRLRQEMLEGAKTFEDVELRLQEALEHHRVGGLIMQFYGHYIYEKFCRDFYERLVQRAGADKARSAIASIRRTIFSSLRAKVGERDASTIDWRGAEGRELSNRILDETLHIFGGSV